MHRGHYGHPGPADDHWSERCLDHVWSVPEPEGNTLKGSMMLGDVFGIFGIVGVMRRERRKSSVLIRSLFGGFRKEFQSNGD
jgi:hypothetical protein